MVPIKHFCFCSLFVFALVAAGEVHAQSKSEPAQSSSRPAESNSETTQKYPSYAGIGVAPYRRPPDHHFRLSGGAGASPIFNGSTSSAFLASYQLEQFVISAAVAENISNSRTPNETFVESNILIGYDCDGTKFGMSELDGAKFYFQATLGIGYWNYSSRFRFGRNYHPADSLFLLRPNSNSNGIGFPMLLQMTYHIYDHVALGPLLFANFNSYRTNYGAAMMLEISYP